MHKHWCELPGLIPPLTLCLQRAEVSRQLREVEKRLMLAANLPPTSPLVPAGAGPSNMQLTPAGPGVSSTGNEGVSGAVLARLTERKKQLEKEVGARA